MGSAENTDALSGTLSPAKALKTEAGKTYSIQFFHSSVFSGQSLEGPAFVDILWNGATIATIRPGYSPWTFYQFTVTAKGNDKLAFHGGIAPAYSFLDDIYVFLA